MAKQKVKKQAKTVLVLDHAAVAVALVGVEERLARIEEHLGIKPASEPGEVGDGNNAQEG